MVTDRFYGQTAAVPDPDDTGGPGVEEGDLLRDTRPEPISGSRYRIVISPAWRVVYAFGGVTMAAALRVAGEHLGRGDLEMVSAQATFCRAIPCGTVVADVEILRNGRKGAQVQVRLTAVDSDPGEPGAGSSGPRSDPEADLVVMVVFARRDPGGPRLLGTAFPEDAPAPIDSRERPAAPPGTLFADIAYHHQTEWRQAVGRLPWDAEAGPGEPRSVSWFRFRRPPVGDDGVWAPWSLAVPGDILGPAVTEGLGRRDGFSLVITLQLSVQFVSPMRGTWLAQHTRANHVGGGVATGVAELWSERRELVAIATQCAMLQPFVPPL